MKRSTNSILCSLFFALLLLGLAPHISAQQIDTLAFQDFEVTPQAPVWTYTGTPNQFLSGFTTASQGPPNSPIGIGGSRAWHVRQVSGGNPVTFDNQTIPGNYDSIRVRFRLAAMNLNSATSGGPDNLDYVLVEYSTDNGSSWVNRLRVRGAVNNNCTWPYSAASTAQNFYLPATEQVFQPVNSGLQLQDGLSTVEIVFPGSITQLSIRITPRSSSSSDSWMVDNLVLIGEGSCTATTSSISPSACDSYLSPAGNTYTMSGTYLDTIPNASNCDSVITVNLTINNSTTASLTETVCNSYTSPGGSTYTASGIYQDTIPNAAGCDSVLTIDLTVNTDASDTLTETACGSYVSPSGQVLTSTGTYQDTIPTTGGCDSLLTINLTINSADTSVSQSGITLTASASGASYQWLDCNNGNQPVPGATMQSFTPTASGSYAVAVTENGCTDTSGCRAVTVVGIDAAWNAKIRIWPNPASEQLNVDLGYLPVSGAVRILDIRGKVLQHMALPDRQVFAMDTEALPAGMYFLDIQQEDRRKRIRFVVE